VALKKRIDPRKFYSEYFDLSTFMHSNRADVRCPFHDDHNPSMALDLTTGHFMCFACDAKGDVIDFYQLYHKLEHKGEALAALEKLWPGSGERGASAEVMKGDPPCETPAKRPARPLRVAPLRRMRGQAPTSRLPPGARPHRHRARERPTLRIPVHGRARDRGRGPYRLSLKKSADGDQRFRWKKGAKVLPYGLWRLKDTPANAHITLVEGEFRRADTLVPRRACPWHPGREHVEGGVGGLLGFVPRDICGGRARCRRQGLSGSTGTVESSGDRVRGGHARGQGRTPPSSTSADPAGFPEAWRNACGAAVPLTQLQQAETTRRRVPLEGLCELASQNAILDTFIVDLAQRVSSERRAPRNSSIGPDLAAAGQARLC